MAAYFSPSVERGLGSQGLKPCNLGVIVVDEDPTTLCFITTLLQTCHYRVETFENGFEALYVLYNRRNEFDLAIIELHMESMLGFMLLERIVKHVGVPVITMCIETDSQLLSYSLSQGACFHIVKPITINNFDVVWKKPWMDKDEGSQKAPIVHNDLGELNVLDESRKEEVGSSTVKCVRRDEGPQSSTKKDNKGKGAVVDYEDSKRPRLQWDFELHQRFLIAIQLLGEFAIPKDIIYLMNVEGLNTKQVASHLQKHRQRIERVQRPDENEEKLPVKLVENQLLDESGHDYISSKTISLHKRPTLPISPSKARPLSNSMFKKKEPIGVSPISVDPSSSPFMPPTSIASDPYQRLLQPSPETSLMANIGPKSTFSLNQLNQLQFGACRGWVPYNQNVDFREILPLFPHTYINAEARNGANWGLRQQPMLANNAYDVTHVSNYGTSLVAQDNLGTAVLNEIIQLPSNMEYPSQIDNPASLIMDSTIGIRDQRLQSNNDVDSVPKENSMTVPALNVVDEWPGLDEFVGINEQQSAYQNDPNKQTADEKEKDGEGVQGSSTKLDFSFGEENYDCEDPFILNLLNDI